MSDHSEAIDRAKAPRNEPVIHFEGVVALLGRFPALSGVDLRVERGEIVLLRGANGSGKTTVLRACAGLLRVTHGTAAVLGTALPTNGASLRRLDRKSVV